LTRFSIIFRNSSSEIFFFIPPWIKTSAKENCGINSKENKNPQNSIED